MISLRNDWSCDDEAQAGNPFLLILDSVETDQLFGIGDVEGTCYSIPIAIVPDTNPFALLIAKLYLTDTSIRKAVSLNAGHTLSSLIKVYSDSVNDICTWLFDQL